MSSNTESSKFLTNRQSKYNHIQRNPILLKPNNPKFQQSKIT
ncbi:6808_t:CDS:2 [Acaulospora morrowiae]|uniref:6808_t:CDS:1 n=1 Tax=Acaulospora morrowiae TaxID=94023 RepID=A0A9N8WDK6_9GLOM|nr:6808_t:CDS:2 [Acaulospora morrowiae]